MEREALIRGLLGDCAEAELQHVESYPCRDFGVFVPSVGYCQCALRRDHTHPSYSFVVLTGEQGRVLFEDPIRAGAGHYLAAALSPGLPHRERTGEAFCRYYAVFVSPSLLEKVSKKCGGPTPIFREWRQFSVAKGIVPLLHRYMAEHGNTLPGRAAALDLLSELIVMDLLRALHHITPESPVLHDAIQLAIHHMHQHFSEQMRMPDLARTIGLSATAFNRKFKEQTGVSPGKYLLRVRLEKAKLLLRTDSASIADIAYQCGFGNPGHLTTAFRAGVGVAPSEYRFGQNGSK